MTLTEDILLLDGAMGTQLRARGVDVPDYKSSIWSALALMQAPNAVRQLHEDYINAGADVITLNTYALSRKLLARENMDERLEELVQTAARVASEAKNNALQQNPARAPALLAGSLAPLNTSYRADLVGSFEENLTAYRETAALLAPHVDVLLCETMSSAQEARAAAMAAAQTGKAVWVSWTMAANGESLRSGETLTQALAALKDLPIEAILLNCCSISAINTALPALMSQTDVPAGAYSNPVYDEPPGGEPEANPTASLGPQAYADAALEWLRLGARLVGGCCDTTPAHITHLRACINNAFGPNCR
jgi:S-methylmethionine-dependent homocysteine/selenocysteine methylase